MSRVKGSASRGETFLEMVKANFIAAREIMIEFVFSLCENGCVPGSVTAPHRTDSIIRLTRGRPGERFCPSSPRRVFDRTGDYARWRRQLLECGGKRSATPLSLAQLSRESRINLRSVLRDDAGAKKAPSPLCFAGRSPK